MLAMSLTTAARLTIAWFIKLADDVVCVCSNHLPQHCLITQKQHVLTIDLLVVVIFCYPTLPSNRRHVIAYVIAAMEKGNELDFPPVNILCLCA